MDETDPATVIGDLLPEAIVRAITVGLVGYGFGIPLPDAYATSAEPSMVTPMLGESIGLHHRLTSADPANVPTVSVEVAEAFYRNAEQLARTVVADLFGGVLYYTRTVS